MKQSVTSLVTCLAPTEISKDGLTKRRIEIERYREIQRDREIKGDTESREIKGDTER